MLEVAVTFCRHDGDFLFLERSVERLWNLPGGKLEKGESPLQAARRELHEEAGIHLAEGLFASVDSLLIRDFTMYIFAVDLAERPSVLLDPAESSDYTWVTLDAALQLPLLTAGDEIIDFFREKVGQRTA